MSISGNLALQSPVAGGKPAMLGKETFAPSDAVLVLLSETDGP